MYRLSAIQSKGVQKGKMELPIYLLGKTSTLFAWKSKNRKRNTFDKIRGEKLLWFELLGNWSSLKMKEWTLDRNWDRVFHTLDLNFGQHPNFWPGKSSNWVHSSNNQDKRNFKVWKWRFQRKSNFFENFNFFVGNASCWTFLTLKFIKLRIFTNHN